MPEAILSKSQLDEASRIREDKQTFRKATGFSFMHNLRKYIVLIALLLVVGNIGFRMGKNSQAQSISAPQVVTKTVVNTATPADKEVDFSLFWNVWDRLNQKYIDKSKLDSQKMVDGAISGMVAALGDPYTLYLPPKENQDFKQDLNGTFEGVGAQLGVKDEKIVVIAPLSDSPAEKAGVKAGDWIVKVNDEDTLTWTVPQAVNKIRGPKGSTVKLTIIHENQPKAVDVSIVRNAIIVKSVEVKFESATGVSCSTNCPEIANVKLSRFGDQTNDEWNVAVTQIRQKMDNGNLKGMILDLRNNPGGYLQSAIYVASDMIKNGDIVVIQENSDGSRQTYSSTRVGNLLNIPIVVLVNKGSASAAEILSGALKDHKRAILVGEKTFGKGSIQTPEDLPGGAGIHITTGKWILPNGDWIHGKGIEPNIAVANPEGASDSADLQLQRAMLELNK